MYGWLGKRDDVKGEVCGVKFDANLPTRNEEYQLLADTLKGVKPGFAYDAGTGYIPEWHVAPYILSKRGWHVDAIDSDPRHLSMPSVEGVYRMLGDITSSGLLRGYDLVTCISVLEHVNDDTRRGFATDAHRVLKRNGLLLVTADKITPERLIALFKGFDFGERVEDPKRMLSPRVSFAVGRKT